MKRNALKILAVVTLLGAASFAATIVNSNFSAVSGNGCGAAYGGNGYVYQVDSAGNSCIVSGNPQQNLNGALGIGWTFADSSAWTPDNGLGDGLTLANSPFNPPSFSTPYGTFSQAAFLQGAGSSVSQTITGLVVNQTYNLSFLVGSRNANVDNGTQIVNVIMGGSQIWTSGLLSNGTPFTLENVSFTATSSSEVLEFEGVEAGDHTAFITDTKIAATPEPVTLVLFGSGLVGIGGIMRRRFVK